MLAKLHAPLVEYSRCCFRETLDFIALRRLENVDTPFEIGFLLCYEAGQIDFALVVAEENSAAINNMGLASLKLGK